MATLVRETQDSPAGPLEPAEARELPPPPVIPGARPLQVLRFSQRQIEFVFRARRLYGDVWAWNGMLEGTNAITSHPDHVKSLFTNPKLAPSITGESALRPVVGPDSVLTANGERHMRQRKLLLPSFHGEAIENYRQLITDATEHEIGRWRDGETIALAPRMQAITLDVIMAGIFGIQGRPDRGTPEGKLRTATRWILWASTMPGAGLAELMNLASEEPVGGQKVALDWLDRAAYAVIRSRREAENLDEKRDILSLLINARTEDGEALTDRELRNELLTLVLAGHETTANQLAWTWERLVRTPDALDLLTSAVRDDEDAEDVVEQTIQEGMRSRPVIPIIGRRVTVPWRLGDYAVPEGSPIGMSILLLHHRDDLYPDPFAFRPERWEGVKPGTYEWIPFGGGIRRCLGAALAMAEQRIVLTEMARRLDLSAVTPEPEHARHRNVTMIPAKGAKVVVRRRAA